MIPLPRLIGIRLFSNLLFKRIIIFLSALLALLLSVFAMNRPLLANAAHDPLTTTNLSVANRLAAPTPCEIRQQFITTTFTPPLNAGPINIDAIEATQSIQLNSENKNFNKYITQRSTSVLVHIEPKPALPNSILLSGCLYVFADNQLTKTVTLRKAHAIQPASGKTTLVFEPFALNLAKKVDLYVELIDANHPLSQTYATKQKFNLKFTLDSVEPLLFYVPVNFVETPDPRIIGYPNGDAMLRAVLPVSDQVDQWWYRPALTGSIPITHENNNQTLICGTIDADGNPTSQQETTLISELSAMLESQVTTHTRILSSGQAVSISIGTMEYKLLYGWVADPLGLGEERLSCNGLTVQAAGISFGATTPRSGQRTYAHEFFHHVYYFHNSIGHVDKDTVISNPGWDVNNHLPADWTGFNILQQKSPATTYAMMTTADERPTNATWISEPDYDLALNYLCGTDLLEFAHHFPECPKQFTSNKHPCVMENNYAIHGFFNATGVRLLPERNIIQNRWYSQPTATYTTLQAKPLPFAMIFRRGEQRIAEIPFDARMISERSDVKNDRQNIRYGFFNIVVPPSIVDQADRIEIRNINGEILPFLTRSKYPPTIEFREPTTTTGQVVNVAAINPLTSTFITDNNSFAPRVLTPTLTSTLIVQTADADGDALTCRFLYSPNAGQTWLPLQVRPATARANIYATHIDIPCPAGTQQEYVITNRGQLPTNTGRGILRAFVNDGFNVRYTDLNIAVPRLSGLR